MKKRIISFVLLFIFIVALASPVLAEEFSSDIAHLPTEITHPKTGELVPVFDTRDEVAQITAEEEINYEEREMFLESRLNQREAATVYSLSEPPIPGGWGFGVEYYSTFNYQYTYGTSISYGIACPRTIGGNNNDFLYLTATNRSAFGTEAYISYWAQNPAEFVVFDWARADWQVWLPYNYLLEYTDTYYDNSGDAYQCVIVDNITAQIRTGRWYNAVYLVGDRYADLVYYYEYSATLTQQQSEANHRWGPMVETFMEGNYSGTNRVGFFGVNVCNITASGGRNGVTLSEGNNFYYIGPFQGWKIKYKDSMGDFIAYS